MIQKFGKGLFLNIINYLLPHRCIGCKDFTLTGQGLCANCFKKLEFITDPFCQVCGQVFNLDIYQNLTCVQCLRHKPDYDVARSIMKYNQGCKKIIHDFKYNDKTFHAKFFAQLIASKYSDILNEVDYITPVPMHRFKRLYRNYNPPFLIAKELSKIINGPKLIPDMLIKTKITKAQTTLKKDQRYANLKGSIEFNTNYDIKKKKILLIDDVHTTGATANFCSLLLKKNKAKQVTFLSVART